MKTARNLLLGLVLLVLIYGGCYRLFYREGMLADFHAGGPSPFDFSTQDSVIRRFYAPAAEIDLRLTWDRPGKQRLAGHWLSKKPGDFLTLAKDGSCRFQLGEFQSSAKLEFDRPSRFYRGRFQHQGGSLRFRIAMNDGELPFVCIGDAHKFFAGFPNLTRAESPD